MMSCNYPQPAPVLSGTLPLAYRFYFGQKAHKNFYDQHLLWPQTYLYFPKSQPSGTYRQVNFLVNDLADFIILE